MDQSCLSLLEIAGDQNRNIDRNHSDFDTEIKENTWNVGYLHFHIFLY